MKPARQEARQRLKQSTRAEYSALIHAAKLTPAQIKIVDLYILQDLSICATAEKLCCCESLVRKRLAEIYDRIAKL